MLVELVVLWIFLTLLSGTAMCAYVRHSHDTHAHTDGEQGLRHAIAPLSAWRVDRDDHA
jgi:hypothetical protein